MTAPGPNYIRLLESAAARRIPLSVLAELTYRCVYRCPHCCLWPRGGRWAELDAAAWKDIFAQLADAGTLFLVLSGGEPFLREDFYELLGAAVDSRFQVRVFTNGYTLTEEDFARLAGSGVAGLDISLYSADEAVYDRVSGLPGSHRRLRRALDGLKRHGVPFSLKMPVMRRNAATVEATARFAASLGKDLRMDFQIFPDPGRGGAAEEMLEGEALAEAFRQSRPWRPSTPSTPRAPRAGGSIESDAGNPLDECIPLASSPPDSSPRDPSAGVPPPGQPDSQTSESTQRPPGASPPAPGQPDSLVDDKAFCAAGTRFCSIDPSGQVFPCAFALEPAGSLRESRFETIWRHSPVLEAWRSLRRSDWARCRGCELESLCQRCPALAELTGGRREAGSEEICRYNRLRAEIGELPDDLPGCEEDLSR